ncbi:acetolactate synthase 2 small subunit [Lonsdalea quercina]|uniref:acetolactate synthase 2 small subunit n=1 Tax=Lonsdalea quercina TaxID=71657 RepID=UPI00397661C1
MKRHQILIQARFRPETLERVLRVTRHRGFQVSAMNMSSQHDGGEINIELTVASQRPVDLLSTQLNKLLDISRVEIQSLKA